MIKGIDQRSAIVNGEEQHKAAGQWVPEPLHLPRVLRVVHLQEGAAVAAFAEALEDDRGQVERGVACIHGPPLCILVHCVWDSGVRIRWLKLWLLAGSHTFRLPQEATTKALL